MEIISLYNIIFDDFFNDFNNNNEIYKPSFHRDSSYVTSYPLLSMATVVKSLKFRKASQQISREVFFDKSISTLSKLVRLAEDAICNAAASISFIKFRRCALEFRGSSPLLIFFKYFLKEIVFTLWYISGTRCSAWSE